MKRTVKTFKLDTAYLLLYVSCYVIFEMDVLVNCLEPDIDNSQYATCYWKCQSQLNLTPRMC